MAVIRDQSRDFTTGEVVAETVYDTEAGTATAYQFGVMVATRAMADAEHNRYRPQPTPLTLPALLVVQGQLDLADAANAAGVAPEALVAEAQAWAVAAGG